MSRGGDATQWTAEQTLSYINGLIAAEDNEDEEQYNQTLYTALSISYEYLTNATKRKITWSLSLEKLAYEFIELAFETNMHASIKDIFKSYRAITQGQYSESLKYVLEHYRDKKLEAILEEEITSADLPLICSLPNIEIEEPSPEIILESLHPEVKQRQMQVRNKLKIVWEGYKSIVETVRVNQKLEDVYMATLNKIFDFVDRYNRVQEFKSFCKSLRTGLQTAFNKRDKAEQQKAIYIDIEKTDVNTRNIEIRMEQFKVTTKLGLWGEAFQALEDIKNLMKVRKAPLKNSLKCQYYESLALLFRKNSFWHYHAFAFYNYYTSYLTKPRITIEEKRDLSDRLLLAILAIPTVPLESTQSKEIQDKVCGMMISSTKVPEKNQLVELMVSRGVLENASDSVRELWNFMFLEFGVSSLQKGLELVAKLKNDYAQFRELIEATLINRQLLSIAEVYQRIRISSLERLIPLPLEKIKRILILAHRQKTLYFTFDESQGIIVFEDQTHQINPTEQFHELFIDVAIAYESERKLDETHIRNKANDYIENAEHNIWNIRQYKIEEFRKKMKKPMLELRNQAMIREKQKSELKEKEELERKVRESEAIKKAEELQKALAMKKIIISDIISIKEQRIVRIMEKKIENLTDDEIYNLTIEVLQEHLENTKKKIANNKESRLKKVFTHIDYLERERRELLVPKIKALIVDPEIEEKQNAAILQFAKSDYEEHHEQQARLQNLAKYYKGKIENEVKLVNNQFDKDLEEYKNRVKDNFKDKILARARAIFDENLKKKEQQLKLAEEQEKAQSIEQYNNGKWGFMKKNKVETATASSSQFTPPSAPLTFGTKTSSSTNVFEKLSGLEDRRPEPKKEQRFDRDDNSKWGIGTKRAEEKKEAPAPVSASISPPVFINSSLENPQAIQHIKVDVNVQEKREVVLKKQPEVEKPKQVEKKAVFAPPPAPGAEKKGKWVTVNEPVKEKNEEAKPAEVKKGKRF